jgi:hypothetical protein
VSSELWVTTPGGLSVATDQILELMDQLGTIVTTSSHLSADLSALSHRFGHYTMRSAHAEAENFHDWCRWLSASLDTYCHQVAQMERARVDLWERPSNRALSTFVQYLSGRPDVYGAEESAALDEAAAGLIGTLSPPGVEVEEVSRQERHAISLTLSERISRIPDTSTPIRIERYELVDGSHHAEVFIAGTNDWALHSNDSAFDMSSNLALVAGVPAASLIATERAMARAGVTRNDSVVFVGHSQGGAVAATLAESGRYHTVGLFTVGAPTGTLPVKGTYPALTVEHSDDVVPHLGGARTPTNAYVVTTDSGALPGDLVGAHERQAYVHTAEHIDKSVSKRLAGMVKKFPRFVRGTVSVFAAGPV